MDSRCPRQLTDYPESPCYLAVLRLKKLRSAEHELSEEEESKLMGCPWAINSQCANYCFFAYCAKIADGNLSDVEIASMLNISQEAVRKAERDGLSKMRQANFIIEVKETYGDEKIVDEAIDESLAEVARP